MTSTATQGKTCQPNTLRFTVNLQPTVHCACRGVEVADRTFDRKVEGSSPDRNIIGCRQEGHPDIKRLTAPTKVLQCRHRPTPNTGENGRKTKKKAETHKPSTPACFGD